MKTIDFRTKFFTRTVRLLGPGLMVLMLALCCDSVEAAVQSDQGRAVPAPWRPSFNPVDRQSLEQAQQSSTQIPPGQSSNQGLGSRAAANTNPSLNSNSSLNRNNNSSNSVQSQTPVSRVANNLMATTPGMTKVSSTFDTLPNESGQIWREYDITPYTSRVTGDAPQQAITDWILKETGTQMWFSQPFGILNSDRQKIIVYHTPEIHRVVKTIIDRFTRTRAQVQAFEINLVSIGNPNWRTNAYTMLQPIEVRSPGIEAWLISKENAAILMGQLANRSDHIRHSGGRVTSPDGQTISIEKTNPVPFVRSIKWTPQDALGYQPINTTINEGYALSISSLTSLDNRSIEAMIKCDVDQVEKLTPVKVNVPQPGGRVSQLDLNIPQLVSWRLHERFRWPSDQVLLLSCGIVASPQPETSNTSGGIGGIGAFSRIPILGSNNKPKRADALMFVDYRGPESEPTVAQTAGSSALVPVKRRQ